jgi:hypothetical protein
MSKLVECDNHGKSKPAFVCKHLVQTLDDQIRRGVTWWHDDDGDVYGYCDECNVREWNDEHYADTRVICEGCFRRVLSINKKTDLN